MTTILSYISIVLTSAALGTGFVLGGRWIGAVPIVVVGILWIVGCWRRWGWTAAVGLALSFVAAGTGLGLGLAAGWMLGGTVAAISAWDLDCFGRSLRAAQRVEGRYRLERNHLLWLLLVDLLGLLLAMAPLAVRLEIGFGWAMLLGLLAIVGLGQALRAFGRQDH